MVDYAVSATELALRVSIFSSPPSRLKEAAGVSHKGGARRTPLADPHLGGLIDPERLWRRCEVLDAAVAEFGSLPRIFQRPPFPRRCAYAEAC